MSSPPKKSTPPSRDVIKGDIVQINPDHHPLWGGCLMIVTEPKSWGAQGYIEIVKSEAEGGRGQAYYRCPKEQYVIVGAAAWIVGSESDEEEDAQGNTDKPT